MRATCVKPGAVKTGALVFLMSALILTAPSRAAEPDLGVMPITLEQTRLFLDEETRRGFLTLKNESAVPVMLMASVFEPDLLEGEGKRSTSLLVSPPRSVIGAGRPLTLKIVLLDRRLPADRESLRYLRLKIVPAQQREETDASTLDAMMTLYAKVFYRPDGLDGDEALKGACPSLRLSRSKAGTLGLHNPTPYWMTLPEILVDGVALPRGDRSPVIEPRGTLPIGDARDRVTYRCVLENGYLSDEFAAREAD